LHSQIKVASSLFFPVKLDKRKIQLAFNLPQRSSNKIIALMNIRELLLYRFYVNGMDIKKPGNNNYQALLLINSNYGKNLTAFQ
jgi:hypothetical protein